MTDEALASYGRVEAECPGFQARATARALTRYFTSASGRSA
jgi:hypothetical protein